MRKNNKISITAHTGCMNTKMNSIESIYAGIKYGADIVEIDLNINKDGEMVLSHDVPKENELYTKLEAALDIIKSQKDMFLNIDVKDTKVLLKLKDIIFKYELCDRVFLTGLNKEMILNNMKNLKGISYFINIEESDVNKINVDKLIDKVEELNALGINIDYEIITPKIISECKKRNKLIFVWTIDKKKEMKKMIKYTVNSITTRRVDILKSILVENN